MSRCSWSALAAKIARPVLENTAAATLRANMPVEHQPGHRTGRAEVTHLEAVGRTLAGVAPWLELEGGELADLARASIANLTDPNSPDFANWTEHHQPLVDAAFLAHALLRAPNELWAKLDGLVQNRLVDCLKSTRAIKPGRNNWLLFSAIIEAFLLKIGAGGDKMRLDYAIVQHEHWYLGDGIYGDGPEFHWDYYNSFVIQPMLLDCLSAVSSICPDWDHFREPVLKRATRYAAIQEHLIAPDGTFPPLGRSLTYRSGCFQLLAQAVLQEFLREDISPAQVRCALSAAYARLFSAPNTFDDAGWLRIGFCGHQPALGEPYISTGSLYLCLAGFLPLGLPDSHPFWSAPDAPWTSQKIYACENLPADKAVHTGRLRI